MINSNSLLILLLNNFIEAALPPPYDPPHLLQSRCQGLDPVYDDQGSLNGYRGVCDVDRWNESSTNINSMHPIDNGILDTTEHRYRQPNDSSFFDWLSPHHDIIHNHPHYRQAHSHHRHCIQEKRTGLFGFIANLFGGQDHDGTQHPDEHQFNDPYMELGPQSRCINDQYYKDNPFASDDPYSLNLAHRIHKIHHKINDPAAEDIDNLKTDLHDHYDRLNRHLDCHCRHELPRSRKYHIHHRPIQHHSIETLVKPNLDTNCSSPCQIHSSMHFDPSMDMEDEHMAMLRMSGFAAQHAHNTRANFDKGSLQMHLFHPVNNSGTLLDQSCNDPERNRLRVEKVIVVKRIKVPAIKTGPARLYDSFDDDKPMQMNSLANAIPGPPCGCINADYNSSHNSFDDDNDDDEMDQSVDDFSMMQQPMSQLAMMSGQMNPMMMNHTIMQPGLQLSPSPNPNSYYNQNYHKNYRYNNPMYRQRSTFPMSNQPRTLTQTSFSQALPKQPQEQYVQQRWPPVLQPQQPQQPQPQFPIQQLSPPTMIQQPQQQFPIQPSPMIQQPQQQFPIQQLSPPPIIQQPQLPLVQQPQQPQLSPPPMIQLLPQQPQIQQVLPPMPQQPV